MLAYRLAARLSGQRVDEPDTAGCLVHRQTQHRGGFALALVAAGAPSLFGCDIVAFKAGDIVASIITAAFHRTHLDLRGGEVLPDHLFLVDSIGRQLGEGRIGLGYADDNRPLGRSTRERISSPRKM